MPGSSNHSQKPEEETKDVSSSTGQTGGGTNPPPKTEEPVSNYEGVYNLLQQRIADNPLETPQQKKKRERREKWEGIVSGISDAASAVTNLIFTTKGAPSMYNSGNSMSKAAQERFDRAKAEREERLDNHLNYALSMAKLKDADRNWRRQLEKDRADAAQRAHDNAIADAKEDRASALFLLQKDLEQNKVNAAEADARRKQIEADYAEKYEKARVNRENASAGASNARANYYDRGGSGGKKAEFVAWDRNGKEYKFRDAKAWEAFARREGTWVEGQKKTTSTKTGLGLPETTETITTGGGYSKKPDNKGKGYGSGTGSTAENGKGKGY